MPFTTVATETPKIDAVSGISTKLPIISPGGKAGITRVTANKQRKAIAKTTAFDMVD